MRKSAIIGALIGGLFTVGIYSYCGVHHPDFLDFSGMIFFYTMLPTMIVAKLFGIPLLDNKAGDLTSISVLMLVVTNAILGMLLGIGIALMMRFSRSKQT